MIKRTHTCGELNKSNVGHEIHLNGWISKSRDLGGRIFIDLRDRYGKPQIVFNEENHINAFNKYLEVILQSGGLPSLMPKPYNEYQCVNVHTIHSVKGAEFPIVFLPFHRSASFPLNFRSEKLISKPPAEWLPPCPPLPQQLLALPPDGTVFLETKSPWALLSI